LGIGVMLLSLLHLVGRTSGAVFEATQFKAEAEAMASRVLAEEFASWLISGPGRELNAKTARSRAGFSLTADLVSGEADDQLKIRVISPAGRAFVYTTQILEGAAPFPLGRSLSISRAALAGSHRNWDWIWKMPIPEPMWLPIGDFPEILPHAQSKQGLNPELIGMRIDREIALLYLDSGTDLDDYLLGAGKDGLVETTLRQDAWVAIDGNLWIAQGKEAVWIELSNHLTIIVHGNIYLGASLRVSGPGRLTLVALRSAISGFRDRDLDGSFSPGDEILDSDGSPYRGWVEGSGAVYLGLPGDTEPAAELQVEGSIVAGGEVYLRVDRAVIHGALVIGRGLTRASERCELRLLGSLLPQTNEESVPGFTISGEARAGQLRLLK